MAMRDIQIRQRGFTEAHERIPSSVADAEKWYNQELRNEARKHEKEGLPYFPDEARLAGGEEYLYQDYYGP